VENGSRVIPVQKRQKYRIKVIKGYVDMQTNYIRNKLNRVPKTLNDLIRLNKTLPVNKRWILLSVANSDYHM